jgi:hypothetical protein
VHEGAVREIMAGDEYGWLAADPEGDDRSMSSAEKPKNLSEGSDSGRVPEEIAYERETRPR